MQTLEEIAIHCDYRQLRSPTQQSGQRPSARGAVSGVTGGDILESLAAASCTSQPRKVVPTTACGRHTRRGAPAALL